MAYTIESLARETFLQLVLAMPLGELIAATVITTCLRDHDHDWLISTIVDAIQPYLIPILEGMSDGCQSALFDDFWGHQWIFGDKHGSRRAVIGRFGGLKPFCRRRLSSSWALLGRFCGYWPLFLYAFGSSSTLCDSLLTIIPIDFDHFMLRIVTARVALAGAPTLYLVSHGRSGYWHYHTSKGKGTAFSSSFRSI